MGTLYGAIKNLSKKGWIVESSREDGKINYIITEEGKEQVNNEKIRLKRLQNLIDKIGEESNDKN